MSYPYGAAHAAELLFLFTPDESQTALMALTPDQERLAATMRRHSTRFATLGAASARQPRDMYWPRYSIWNNYIQIFGPPMPQRQTDFAQDHHCDFWMQVLMEGLLDG